MGGVTLFHHKSQHPLRVDHMSYCPLIADHTHFRGRIVVGEEGDKAELDREGEPI